MKDAAIGNNIRKNETHEDENIGSSETGIGPAVNVLSDGRFLYVLQNESNGRGGSLIIESTEDPLRPAETGRVDGIGNARQAALSGHFVFITARQDGLVIVDAADPEAPKLLRRYDTVEFATAVCISGDYLFVGCRNYGVEVLDVSNPACPVHVSYVRAGEVQSLTCENGLLATGSWGERSTSLFDVRDPYHPVFLSTTKVGGRADGVCIRGDRLYCAIGHFGHKCRERSPSDPEYGRGNGFDILDISDPVHPKLIAEANLGFRFYYHSFDMWKVSVSGNYAYLGHTWNGFFLYDISDETNPKLIKNWNYPIPKDDPRFFEMVTEQVVKSRPPVLPFDPSKEIRSPVVGFSLGDGCVYAATAFTDVYCIVSETYFHRETHSEGLKYVKNTRPVQEKTADSSFRRFDVPGAFVHYVQPYEDKLFLATADRGLVVLDRETHAVLSESEPGKNVLDMRINGRFLYTAELNDGMGVYDIGSGLPVRVGSLNPGNSAVRQIGVCENGRHAFLKIAEKRLAAADVSDPYHPKAEWTFSHGIGLTYERQMTFDPFGGNLFGCFWGGGYLHWFDGSAEKARVLDVQHELRINAGNVVSCPCGSDPYRFLAVNRGGYSFGSVFGAPEERGHVNTGAGFVPDVRFGVPDAVGRPRLFGNLLILTHRPGLVTAFDISDIMHPECVLRESFESFIDSVSSDGEKFYFALGRSGVGIWGENL